MRAPIIVVPFLNYAGMAVFPFILVKSKDLKADSLLIQHETIHLMQQLELLVLPFYVLYVVHYLINLLVFQSHNKAYRNIVFEREAYRYEAEKNYLHKRRLYAWMHCF
jgi:hypothetical protein